MEQTLTGCVRGLAILKFLANLKIGIPVERPGIFLCLTFFIVSVKILLFFCFLVQTMVSNECLVIQVRRKNNSEGKTPLFSLLVEKPNKFKIFIPLHKFSNTINLNFFSF